MISREEYQRIERELRETRGIPNVLALTLPLWERLYWELAKEQRRANEREEKLEIDSSLITKLLAKLLVERDYQRRLFPSGEESISGEDVG